MNSPSQRLPEYSDLFNGPEPPRQSIRGGNDSPDGVRERVHALVDLVNAAEAQIALGLAYVERDQRCLRSWGYTSLVKWIQDEVGLSLDESKSLRRIVRIFRKHGVPGQVLVELGRTKAEALSYILGKGDDSDWILRARQLSAGELKHAVEKALGQSIEVGAGGRSSDR